MISEAPHEKAGTTRQCRMISKSSSGASRIEFPFGNSTFGHDNSDTKPCRSFAGGQCRFDRVLVVLVVGFQPPSFPDNSNFVDGDGTPQYFKRPVTDKGKLALAVVASEFAGFLINLLESGNPTPALEPFPAEFPVKVERLLPVGRACRN